MRLCTGRRVMSWPSNMMVPAFGGSNAGQHVEERRLPGAVRADEAVQLVRMTSRLISCATTSEPKRLFRPDGQDRLRRVQPSRRRLR
jgi:hypothetical protein